MYAVCKNYFIYTIYILQHLKCRMIYITPTRVSYKTNRIPYHYRNSVIYLLAFALFIILLYGVLFSVLYIFKFGNIQKHSDYIPITLNNINVLPVQILSADSTAVDVTNSSCTYFGCFNVYRCGSQGNRLLVYVYPLKMYLDTMDRPIMSKITKEFYQILNTIINSKFYTPNPYEACIFIPSIDTLNQNRLRLKEVSKVLGLLPL